MPAPQWAPPPAPASAPSPYGQAPYGQAPYEQPPANPYAQQGFAPPGYGRPFTPLTPPKRNQTRRIIVGVLAVCAFLGVGWVVSHRPGPVLTVADVQMRTPVGWKTTSKGAGAAFLEGMARSMKVDPASLVAQTAEHRGRDIAAVATMHVPTVVSADALLAGLQHMDPAARARAGLSDATSITVGSRAAVEVSIATDGINGTMVFVPEGTTWVLCIVGTVGGAVPDSDRKWIIQHLTTK